MGAISASAEKSLAEGFNTALKRELLEGPAAFPDQETAYRAVIRGGRIATATAGVTSRSTLTTRTSTRPTTWQQRPLLSRKRHNRTSAVSTIKVHGPCNFREAC